MGFCSPEDLEKIYAKYAADVETTDISNLVTLVQVELGKYKDTVTGFFTDKADEIRFIYKSIRENSFPYNKIMAADSNKARHLYLEYFEGLQQYIQKLLDLKSTDEIDKEKLENSLIQISQRDHEFVDSLYQQERNPEEEMDIDSGMKNIEVLIDVYNSADQLSDALKKYVFMVDDADPEYVKQMVSGLKIMANSIRHFHKDIIKEILECYEKIHNSIQKRTPAMGEKVIETYQLF